EREPLPEETVAYRCVNTECDDFFERKKCKRAKCPEACPRCGNKLEVLDAGIEIYCPNPAWPAQAKERLRWFCHRGQMDIEGVGDQMLEPPVERGMVKTFADLYKLTTDDIATLGSEVEQNEKVVKRTVGEK